MRPGKEKCIIAFDDGCHLLRVAQRRRGLNAQVDSFLDRVITVGECCVSSYDSNVPPF